MEVARRWGPQTRMVRPYEQSEFQWNRYFKRGKLAGQARHSAGRLLDDGVHLHPDGLFCISRPCRTRFLIPRIFLYSANGGCSCYKRYPCLSTGPNPPPISCSAFFCGRMVALCSGIYPGDLGSLGVAWQGLTGHLPTAVESSRRNGHYRSILSFAPTKH